MAVIAPPTVERSATADDTPPSDPCRKLRRSMLRNPAFLIVLPGSARPLPRWLGAPSKTKSDTISPHIVRHPRDCLGCFFQIFDSSFCELVTEVS
jgi:hypothetical protein